MGSAVLLSIVLPSFDELENLVELLPSIRSALDRAGLDSEILVVQRTTEDSLTKKLCASVGAKSLARGPSDSYGDALRTGIQQATGDFIAVMDADGSHRPVDLLSLWEVRSVSRVVIGSRYLRLGGNQNGPVLLTLSRILNWSFQMVSPVASSDISNSLRLYPRAVISDLKLVAADFDIHQEILLKIMIGHPEVQFMDIPCVFEQRKHGASKRRTMGLILPYLKMVNRYFRHGFVTR